MGDIKLFRTGNDSVAELDGGNVGLEKSLQALFERTLEALLGVRFLASEFSTTNGGRMDTLGIDENNCPVIIEYKRASNENVINQGLFYLDWLMDHRRDFEWLVMDKCGKEEADRVEWSAPRLICIAGDFTKFDENAVNQMNRNIELIRYRHFEADKLLMLDLISAVSAKNSETTKKDKRQSASRSVYTVTDCLAAADEKLTNLYASLEAFLVALGDDIQQRTLQNYFAFKRIKNFACVEVKPQAGKLLVYVKVDPDSIALEPGFTRDVRSIGHVGTGELEITITSDEALERAKPLFEKSYAGS